MCGEIDDHALVGQELADRLRTIARRMRPDDTARQEAPPALAEEPDRAAYMERVFRRGLARAVADVAAADDEAAVDALALHAIALARLSGFLAGQLPPEADLFRALIEAVTAGHAEAREASDSILRERDHHHHHHHSPEHEHT